MAAERKRLNVEFNSMAETLEEPFLKDFPFYEEGLVRGEPGGFVLTKIYGENAQQLYNFHVRPDDVWVLSFPKSGKLKIILHLQKTKNLNVMRCRYDLDPRDGVADCQRLRFSRSEKVFEPAIAFSRVSIPTFFLFSFYQLIREFVVHADFLTCLPGLSNWKQPTVIICHLSKRRWSLENGWSRRDFLNLTYPLICFHPTWLKLAKCVISTSVGKC